MLLSVFTPTYNRRELLRRTYNSLLKQTDRDFVWIIVDDGSTDDTESLVNQWIKDGLVNIRYKYTENGGKMRAHNKGVLMCETELFVCLDSDDYFVDDAVESIKKAWNDASESFERRQQSEGRMLGGIIAHKGRSASELLSDCEFPISGYSGLYELYLKGFRGETTFVIKTEALRLFPFPEIDGEKYVPEDYIYDKIDEKYVHYLLPKILTVCEIVDEGYTASVRKLKLNNKLAWYLYYEQRTRITPPSLLKIKYSGYYVIYAHRTSNRLIKKGGPSLLYVLTGLVAAIMLKLTRRE